MKIVSFLSLDPWHWTCIFPPQQLHGGYITYLLSWTSISGLIKFYHWQTLIVDLCVDESERRICKCNTAKQKDLNESRQRNPRRKQLLCSTPGFCKACPGQWAYPPELVTDMEVSVQVSYLSRLLPLKVGRRWWTPCQFNFISLGAQL